MVAAAAPPTDEEMTMKRKQMVEKQMERRGITDARVLEALRAVERHRFVPETAQEDAYEDYPLAIGFGQTISQPYIVALMTESIEPKPGDRVLEIGTGSGYQAAVLSLLVKDVYSIEIVEELGLAAAERLAQLGYDNVHVRVGDGYQGWPEHAPFDAIVVTAAPPEIPQALVDQLAEGGRMVIPVGTSYQELLMVEKKNGKVSRRVITVVRFVPMVPEKK
ncbi:MAG: protein-L-isoaspartate(D-aspartate) O-methyltransferase [Candidatus Krumholzibacteria bacterium]|nr:protein-L-isoaspartate(D-aspartate) O-methyltransferase [Candidatus Krumholzibacteria bacterium]MDH4337744.1 protein-L-isoaspartate(D-aspartate) O-methyltransferase [Candidatus Krumholzibacteria bacterium]MDH5271111.1 protein-L-isoaspartate(D-aspartate) O-methyltransferase [Candidatus Krumholzibacteria bacterium]MDH5627956.1 protein-L-isoaspartate(D-aspartate) O-methyltransferase [Candidatus Krumholzibacteria bacterium]